jgi:hypothetical protein
MPEEEHRQDSSEKSADVRQLDDGKKYLRNSYYVLFTSYYYSVKFMEDENSRK